MTKVFTKDEIIEVVPRVALIQEIEKGLMAFSDGKVDAPPPGELLFESPPGETLINYGRITETPYYIVKVGAQFLNNSKLGLPTGSSTMLVCSAETGQVEAVLLEEGYLTALRTAITGAIAAKYLAPKNINGIGIIGTGIQARMQLEYLEKVTSCKEVMVWGRHKEKAKEFAKIMGKEGFNVEVAASTAAIGSNCNLIITATSAVSPVILDKHIKKGTHITAIGADNSEKNELEAITLARADLVVTDSLEQARRCGEVFQTWINGLISDSDVLEMGNMIKDKAFQRNAENQITVADITGSAVLDIQIAQAVYEQLIK